MDTMWIEPVIMRMEGSKLSYKDLNRIYNNANNSSCRWVYGLDKTWQETDFLLRDELKNLLRVVKHMGEANNIEIAEWLTADNFNKIEKAIQLEHDTPYRQELPFTLEG